VTRDDAYLRYHRHASRLRPGRPAAAQARVVQTILNSTQALGIYALAKRVRVAYTTARAAADVAEDLGIAQVVHDGRRLVVRALVLSQEEWAGSSPSPGDLTRFVRSTRRGLGRAQGTGTVRPTRPGGRPSGGQAWGATT